MPARNTSFASECHVRCLQICLGVPFFHGIVLKYIYLPSIFCSYEPFPPLSQSPWYRSARSYHRNSESLLGPFSVVLWVRIELLKEHVALDQSSWSLKSCCNRLLQNAYGQKDVVKVEYNDPHKHASNTLGFPFTSSTNTVGHLWESNFCLP